MGYLNRMGFFDYLADVVEVLPSRPAYSAAEMHRGANAALVEIARINKDARDEELPTRLTDALMRSCRTRPDAGELKGAAWTIFAELIDNIFPTAARSWMAMRRYRCIRGETGYRLLCRIAASASCKRFARLSAPSFRSWRPFRHGFARRGVPAGAVAAWPRPGLLREVRQGHQVRSYARRPAAEAARPIDPSARRL